ncbi:MAG: 30S ribosomal protein S6 [Syntrophobacteria bacterium]
MRQYETLFIVTPDSSEEDLKAVATKIKGVVTGMNGIVTSYDEQGRKKLAYSVKKQNKGYYVLMDYVGSADIVSEIERNMRLDDRVLKYLTVKLADQVDPESIEPEKSEPPEEAEAAEVPEPEAAEAPEPEAAEAPEPEAAEVPEAEAAEVPEAEAAEALEPGEAESPEVQVSEESEKKES